MIRFAKAVLLMCCNTLPSVGPTRFEAVRIVPTSPPAIHQSGFSHFPAVCATLQQLFAGRDELITLLARSDPASADRLADLFVTYRKIMNG